VSPDQDSSAQVKERLSQIAAEAAQLVEETKTSYGEVTDLIQRVVENARAAREQVAKLQNLKAEATYLSLRHDFGVEDIEVPGSKLESVTTLWRDLESNLRPVGPSSEWLEKIRELEEKRRQSPALTSEERADLELRLKENVCPLCVSYALDGTCTNQSFETCPITIFLDQVVEMIEDMGHRPWMEDYFERMYRSICPGCKGRVDKDYCPPREEGDCSLFTYLPSVVKTIELFLNERAEKRALAEQDEN
jgi:hypothetical protein